MKRTLSPRTAAAVVLAAGLSAIAAAAAGQTPAPSPSVTPRLAGWPRIGPRPYIGLTLLDLTPELRSHLGAPRDTVGVLVSRVDPDSPAARAGIAVGDVLTRVDGDPITGFWDVSRAIADRHKGDKVEVELVRDRAVRKISVTLDERGAELLSGWKQKTMVIRPGEGGPERTIVIDGEDPMPPATTEVMEHFFKTPEWQAKLGDITECDRVRKRLEEVEARLKALEEKLHSK